MTAPEQRPATAAPEPVGRDTHSAPFFDAAARHRLLLRYSPGSGEWSEPAAVVCSVTQARDLEWREASGRGHLVTWTVKRDRVIGIVELDEGPWLTLLFPDAKPAGLRIGAAVTVVFTKPGDGEFVPVGALVEDGC